MTYLARYESSRSGGERGEFDLDVQSRLGAERRARGRRLGTIPTERALVRIFKDTANLSSCTYTAQSSLVLPASMYADPAAPVTSPACRSATICQCAPCMSTLEPEGTHRWVGLAMADVDATGCGSPSSSYARAEAPSGAVYRRRSCACIFELLQSGYEATDGRPCFIRAGSSRASPEDNLSSCVTAGAITRVLLARTGLTTPFRPNAGAPDSAGPRDYCL